MSSLYFLISIIDRSRLLDVIHLYEEECVQNNLVALGRGTAPTKVLDMLGLNDSEKAVCFSVVTEEKFKSIKRELQRKIQIDVPGTGIVFTVPMSSIGGIREFQYLTDGLGFEQGEESIMKETKHELLVIICNQGYSDVVMEAAKSAGAGGGTVIHAQGTGQRKAEQFLGISLASEKDVIFVVTKTSQKKEMMESIMKEAGLETKAKAIVFTLPVVDTAGLRLLEEE